MAKNKKKEAPKGEPREAVLQEIALRSYSTGSFGVQCIYEAVDPNGEDTTRIWDQTVLRTLTDDGEMKPTKYGFNTLKARLKSFGFTSEEINAIEEPKSPKANLNLDKAVGAKVTLYVSPQEGTDFFNVHKVVPRE